MKAWQEAVLGVVLLSQLLAGCAVEDIDKNIQQYQMDTNSSKSAASSAVGSTSPTSSPDSSFSSLSSKPSTTIVESLYQKRDFTEEEKRLLGMRFFISKGVPSAKRDISNYQVDYPYSELYSNQISQNKYIPQNNDDFIYSGKVDYQKLVDRVLKNNAEYMEKYNIKSYASTTDSFVKLVCRHIEKQVNLYISQGLVNERLMNEKLENLKVFAFSDYASGFYMSDKGILALNISNMNNDEIIDHEVGHLLQSASINEITTTNYLNRFGFCYQNSKTEINPTYWNWFFETSAESLSMEQNDYKTPNYYASGYQQLEGIKLANLKFDTELEKTLISGNTNDFYKWFNTGDGISKKEINNFFYANTILLNYSPGQEGCNFYKALETKYQIKFSGSESNAFKEELRGIIALSQAKMFYSTLLNKMNNESVSLEEVFSIISVIESELSRQTWYKTKYAYQEEFLKGYCVIQEELFSVLSVNSNIAVDDLKELYFLYNANINCNEIIVGFLTKKENAGLQNILDTRKANKKDAILKIYEDNYGYGSRIR